MRPLPWMVVVVLTGGISACASSSVLDAETRAVPIRESGRVWRRAEQADIPGLYASVAIEGTAAAVLHEVHYYFAEDGTYSGAALIGAAAPQFQVLTGVWNLDGEGLSLSAGGEPARADVADDLLRLSGTEGTVLLKKRDRP